MVLVLKRDVNLALVLELTIPKILSITCHFQTKSFLLISSTAVDQPSAAMFDREIVITARFCVRVF